MVLLPPVAPDGIGVIDALRGKIAGSWRRLLVVVVRGGRDGAVVVLVFLRLGPKLEALVDTAADHAGVVGIGRDVLLALLDLAAAEVENDDDEPNEEEDRDDDDENLVPLDRRVLGALVAESLRVLTVCGRGSLGRGIKVGVHLDQMSLGDEHRGASFVFLRDVCQVSGRSKWRRGDKLSWRSLEK